jgi:hypothetical protein
MSPPQWVRRMCYDSHSSLLSCAAFSFFNARRWTQTCMLLWRLCCLTPFKYYFAAMLGSVAAPCIIPTFAVQIAY